jgi:outer membrane beta-barrel protein
VRKGFTRAAAAALGLLASGAALAAAPEQVVVTHRLYNTDSRFEMSLLAGMSLNNKLTEHYTGWLTIAYNPSNNYAIEVVGLGSYARLNGVALQARDAVFQEPVVIGPKGSQVDAKADDFADLWQLRYGGMLAFRWNPVYGKINLASELPVHFNFFLSVGAGALGLHKDSVAFCVNGPGKTGGDPTQRRSPDATCGQYLTEDSVKLGGTIAGGLRLWLNERWSLRAEVRDVTFFDSYRTDILRGDAESGVAPDSVSQQSSDPGISNIVEFSAGATVLF